MNNWPVLHRVDRLPATLRNMKADNKNKCGNGAAAASVCGQPPASAFRRNAEAPRRLSEGAEVGLLLLHCCTAARQQTNFCVICVRVLLFFHVS